ncbi:hypothetical protein [Lacticaseibacillus paracasei]|uniref:Lipoprotein n=1 Tax=Lacticaseibacillus paracasei TaxID=1597 RepID=A0AAW6A6E9_LACPA|nr:hypothetical protein [Lacticaseibacillus paracasei]MDB1565469.1 hypothetical protein [Lacticaseibacillus paracasei]
MNKKLTVFLTSLLLTVSLSGCASWNRFTKNIGSDVNNGLLRRIRVYNVDGKVIFDQKGKFDIDYKDHDVQYIDQKNRKHNIYIGSGTVIVDELK